jgi:hypothetical protein
MTQRWWLYGVMGLALLCGCVDMKQEIHVNHDGSGKIVERIQLTPRGKRMMEGFRKKKGMEALDPVVLSDALFQERLKTMGEVELKSRKTEDLPDGRKVLKAEYAFKDINKVMLWMLPTMAHFKGFEKRKIDGKMKFNYRKEPQERWGRIYREEMRVKPVPRLRDLVGPEPMTPAKRQEYKRVVQVFQDMLEDFNLTITLVAPIEEFEERGMVGGFPFEGNTVTLLRVKGKDLVSSPEAILLLVSNEFYRTRSTEREIGKMFRTMPRVYSPWIQNYNGCGIRFLKTERKK